MAFWLRRSVAPMQGVAPAVVHGHPLAEGIDVPGIPPGPQSHRFAESRALDMFAAEAGEGLCRMIIHRAPANVASIVRVALTIGHRRVGLDEFGNACGVPRRTIEWRLGQSSPITVRQLLASSLLLHSAWRMERLGWNIKRAAAAAGFRDRNAFANYVKRNGALCPSQLSRLGVVRLIDRFAGRLWLPHREESGALVRQAASPLVTCAVTRLGGSAPDLPWSP